MITNRWIEKRRPHWERLGQLLGVAQQHGLKGLSAEQLRELAFLYRQIASDLSALRQDGSAPQLVSYLNQLLLRAHTFVYSARKPGLGMAFRYLWFDYPVLVRKLLPFVLASLLLFLSGGLLGTLLTLARPEFMRAMLGPAMVATIERHEMWTHSVSSMAPQAASGITTNNLSVTFTTYAAGITAGLGTLYMIGWNGVLLGVVATACAQAHMSLDLWSFVAAHGSLELPAIILAGAAGLRLAFGWLFPGIYSRRHSTALAGRESIRLMAGVIPMLLIAGTLEGFLSPSAAPIAIKFTTGALLFTLLNVWLFVPRAPAGPSEPNYS